LSISSGHVLPRHEVSVGRGERLRVLRELVAGLLLDLLKDLAALVRVDQLLGAERGDRLAFDLVRRQVEILRLVADAAGPVRRPDDEQAPELEQVDGLLAVVGLPTLACGAGAVRVVMDLLQSVKGYRFSNTEDEQVCGQTVTRRLSALPLSGCMGLWPFPAGLVWLSSHLVTSVTDSGSVFDSGRISGMAARR
jgi:hypothetical protein